jgi:hypothetical protein
MMDFIHQLWWRPKIGDPTFMGWLTVVAYGLAAFTAWLAARRAGRAPGLAAGSRSMWLLVAMLMAALCINKQLDLQSLFTAIGRVISKNQGWYEERREFQKWFVLGALGVSFLLTVLFIIRFRGFWKSHFLLASGLVFLLTFIVVRAISFHHVDMLLKHEVSGVRMNWFLELTGIGLIWLAAIWDWRNPRRISTRPGKVPAGEKSWRS